MAAPSVSVRQGDRESIAEASMGRNSGSRRGKQAQKPFRSHYLYFISMLALVAALVSIYWKTRSRLTSLIGSDAYIVTDIVGKGKGLVANYDLRPGDRILEEKPLLSVPISVHGMSPSELLASTTQLLSKEELQLFFSLSSGAGGGIDHGPRSVDSIMAIFQTNAIATGPNAAIFPTAARMNHGCSFSFNAVYSWREAEGILVVHALKPIKRGQEILTAYTDTKKSRQERRDFLAQRYGFECSCSTCALPTNESHLSDQRLQELSILYGRLATWSTGHIDGYEATNIVNRLWQIEDLEDYTSERGQLASDAAHVAAAHSDEIAVKEWAELAMKWYSIELGSDSLQVKNMLQIISIPQTHAAWNSRQPFKVSHPLLVAV